MRYTIAASALIGLASAHNIVTHFHINGTPRNDCVRIASSTNPITDLTSQNMACNAVKGNAKAKCTIKGGDSIAFEWRTDPGIPPAQYPLKDGTIPVGVTDDSHKGPCAIYMKKVDDSLTAAGPGDGWFKVSEDGVDGAGTFCTDRLRTANAPQPGVVPKNIPSGDYLFRAEMLTLNNAGPASSGGQEEPQFYVGCVQVTVEGTSGTPEVEKVSIPGYLTKSSPGLIYDIWNPKTYTGYPMPGPKPLTPGSGSGGTSAPSGTPTTSSPAVPVKTSKNPNATGTGTGSGSGSGGAPAPSKSPATSSSVAPKTPKPTAEDGDDGDYGDDGDSAVPTAAPTSPTKPPHKTTFVTKTTPAPRPGQSGDPSVDSSEAPSTSSSHAECHRRHCRPRETDY